MVTSVGATWADQLLRAVPEVADIKDAQWLLPDGRMAGSEPGMENACQDYLLIRFVGGGDVHQRFSCGTGAMRVRASAGSLFACLLIPPTAAQRVVVDRAATTSTRVRLLYAPMDDPTVEAEWFTNPDPTELEVFWAKVLLRHPMPHCP